MKTITCFATALALGACASSTPVTEPARTPAEEVPRVAPTKPAEPVPQASPAPASEETSGVPTRCSDASSEGFCLPPPYIAKALCNEDWPTLALAMFAKGTPWRRGYSVTTSAAWNASGGASSNEPMAMYEELLVLRRRGADTGGIQVSGAGNSYDVLRWDGSCVTLQDGELTFQTPPKITSARVVAKRLEVHVRDALKEAPELEKLFRAHRKECKGVTVGDVSKECEKLDGQLSVAIAMYVRDRGGVPEPRKLPKRK
jgi:hypothetical protein